MPIFFLQRVDMNVNTKARLAKNRESGQYGEKIKNYSISTVPCFTMTSPNSFILSMIGLTPFGYELK